MADLVTTRPTPPSSLGELPVPQGHLPIGLAPISITERLAQNKALITALAPQVQQHHLMQVDGHSYVRVAGGIALAEALGYAISVGGVHMDRDSDEVPIYHSTATLIDRATGALIATAEGYLGMDEPRWSRAPIYARRSMCQTRAVAKLCRINFGSMYIMLGASSDTPAEEIPDRAAAQLPPKPAGSPAPSRPRATAKPSGGASEILTPVSCKVLKTGKSARGEWTLYGIEFAEGDKCSTFHTNSVEIVQEAIEGGHRVEVSFTAGRNGNDLQSARLVMDQQPVESVTDDEVPF